MGISVYAMTLSDSLNMPVVLEDADFREAPRPGLGAYEPCRDITPPTMIRLPDVRGKLQSSFTVTCSRFRLIIIVFDTSAFSEFPELFVHNACCATSARTRTPQTAVDPE